MDLQSYWICILTAEDLCDPHLAVLCVSLQQVTLIHPPSNGGSGEHLERYRCATVLVAIKMGKKILFISAE